MRYLALSILLAAGCSSSIGNSEEGTADARPIDFRETPEPKEGTGTALGCDGVTARGECQQGSAVYCDLDRGRKRTVDCKALGQNCILDIGRGAVCKLVGEDTGNGSGEESPCKDTGISEVGFCANNTAVYCDTSGSEPTTRTWDCAAAGKTCAVGEEDCATGAFCCGGEPAPDVTGSECGDVTYEGTCEGDVATWCDPVDGLMEVTCADENKRCEEDTCATGAYCCGATADATPDQQMCAELGLAGQCNADNTVATYCLGEEIITDTCSDGKVCENDTCGFGALCCEPVVAVSECTTIGWNGVCKDDKTVRFCAGTTDDSILEYTCDENETCKVDPDTGSADCEEEIDLCAGPDAIGAIGDCEGETLRYCLGGNLTEVDCTATSKTCQVDQCLSGMANCCE